MEKHLLVTVSEEKSWLQGIGFVAGFLDNREELRVTLFFTAPRPPEVWADEMNRENLEQLELKEKQFAARGTCALARARKILISQGFDPEKVGTKLVLRQQSTFEDIVNEGRAGLYDAIVLGRRGADWMDKLYGGSVSQSMLDQDSDCPLWICRNCEQGRKNVLLCVDGSKPSLRMADHVGFMLSGQDQRVVIFGVEGSDADENARNIELAKGLVMESGVSAERVEVRTGKGNVAKAILSEADKGRYAVVAMGRVGAGRGLLPKMLMGSVSLHVFNKLENAALWVSR